MPEGTDWIDFWRGDKYRGGQTVEVPAPIDEIPLMVKAGSILPMGPYLQYAEETPAAPIELRVYTGADAEFVIYEDEGDNYNYEKGVYATIPVKWNEKEQRLTIGERKGECPGMLKKRTFRIIWVEKGHGTGMEPEQNADKVVKYSGKEVKVKK
jgi:alpha-D-xyloside xylohydrolase